MKLDASNVEDCARMALGGNADTILLEEIMNYEQPNLRKHLNDFIILAESSKLSVEEVADRAATFVYACARFGHTD